MPSIGAGFPTLSPANGCHGDLSTRDFAELRDGGAKVFGRWTFNRDRPAVRMNELQLLGVESQTPDERPLLFARSEAVVAFMIAEENSSS